MKWWCLDALLKSDNLTSASRGRWYSFLKSISYCLGKKMCQYSSLVKQFHFLSNSRKQHIEHYSVLHIPHEQQEFGQDLTGFCLSA